VQIRAVQKICGMVLNLYICISYTDIFYEI
jgi:hypothetical protein